MVMVMGQNAIRAAFCDEQSVLLEAIESPDQQQKL